jgi:hypothetical protein
MRAAGKFNINAAGVKFNLPLIKFQEEDVYFIYSPALDLTGYGRTEEEAKASFGETIDQFLDYTIKKKTLFSELRKLGWKVTKKKISQSPSLVDMITKNNYLAEIFEQKQYQKLNQTISIPELV